MNDDFGGMKKIANALADLLKIWIIELERKQSQTKGKPKHGTSKDSRSWPKNPGAN